MLTMSSETEKLLNNLYETVDRIYSKHKNAAMKESEPYMREISSILGPCQSKISINICAYRDEN